MARARDLIPSGNIAQAVQYFATGAVVGITVLTIGDWIGDNINRNHDRAEERYEVCESVLETAIDAGLPEIKVNIEGNECKYELPRD